VAADFLVRQHFLFASPAAAPLLSTNFFKTLLLFAFFFKNLSFDFFTEIAAGDIAIEFAGPLSLAFHLNSGGQMFQINARSGFIDFLAAFARAQDKFLDEIILTDMQPLHPRSDLAHFFFADVHTIQSLSSQLQNSSACKIALSRPIAHKMPQNHRFSTAVEFCWLALSISLISLQWID